MIQYSSVFKMKNYNKNTISNTVENKVEKWFKERISTRASFVVESPIPLKNTIEKPIKSIKPPGLTLQNNVFTTNEINELLCLPNYSDFLYVNNDMIYESDSISKLLLNSTNYSTPLCIIMD
jgi:uncharacterized protein YllA (UPF0747 family)